MSQEIKVHKRELNRRSWQGSGTVPCSRLVSHWAHSCQVSFWPYDQQVIKSCDCFKASFNYCLLLEYVLRGLTPASS